MKIDGKAIAASIFESLTQRTQALREKDIVPHLAIILVGVDPASQTYVRQKVLKAEMIAAKATVLNLPLETSQQSILTTIQQWNNDNNVHGIIVQRPLPKQINSQVINDNTNPNKDIDAFHKDSPFTMPLAAAVMKILEYIYVCRPGEATTSIGSTTNFLHWLQSKNIVVIGKGETGGGPTIALLRNLGVEPLIIDSKTKNPSHLTKRADIIISTVGRNRVVQKDMIKSGAILIGVGMYKGDDGKLHADYEEADIHDIASCYTPVPGGVGPVNVAMLLENLIQAAEQTVR